MFASLDSRILGWEILDTRVSDKDATKETFVTCERESESLQDRSKE